MKVEYEDMTVVIDMPIIAIVWSEETKEIRFALRKPKTAFDTIESNGDKILKKIDEDG